MKLFFNNFYEFEKILFLSKNILISSGYSISNFIYLNKSVLKKYNINYFIADEKITKEGFLINLNLNRSLFKKNCLFFRMNKKIGLYKNPLEYYKYLYNQRIFNLLIIGIAKDGHFCGIFKNTNIENKKQFYNYQFFKKKKKIFQE